MLLQIFIIINIIKILLILLIYILMSQSDYLKQKKMNKVVKTELPQVLSTQEYTNYKQHYRIHLIHHLFLNSK